MKDLTVPQAATLLGLKPRSVRKFIERGMIRGEKRGRDWFITQEEVDRYNRERRKPGLPGQKQIHSPEAIEKMRQARIKNNPMKGSKHTPEALAKMSAAQSKQPRGAQSHAWKGGRVVDRGGYILIYAPTHPCSVGRYVQEHRLVAEQMIGRLIEPHEVVHHINGIITDNRPENLQVMTQSEHSRFHRLNPHIRKIKEP